MADLATTLARARVPLGFVCSVAVLWLAQPTARTLMLGGLLALVGEAIRFWAAGHLEKGIEITRSGPYRYVRHPLYFGSSLIGTGIAIAADRRILTILIVMYLTTTIAAAIRHEEASMRERFGAEYQAYVESRAASVERPFSLARALKNKEHHTIVGLLAVWLFFAFKASRHL